MRGTSYPARRFQQVLLPAMKRFVFFRLGVHPHLY